MNRTIIYQPLLIAFLVLLFAQESKLISPINQCTPTTELTTARAITFFQQTKPNPGQLIMELENLLLGVKNSTSKIQLLNDLAATYFWRGQCERNFADIAHALSLIDQAIAIDQAPKTAPEKLLPSTAPITAIYYNRALILETLMPRTIALEAWQQYLQQPLSNDQRSIAQRHLEKSEIASLDEIWHTQVQHFTANAINTNTTLTTDIANQQPHNARLYIIEQLLPAWATAVQQSQPQQAAAILKAASRLAQAIPFSVDGQLVREAVSSAQQNATNKLAQGYLALQAGQTLATQSQFGPASTEFKAARDAFDPALYPAVYAYTTMLLAIIEPDPSQAEQYINEVIQISQARNYPYLLGRVWSRRSGIKGREFDIVAAIESQTQAIKYLKQSASWELLAQGYFVMSDVLNQIGEKEDIQQPQLHALEELQKFSYSKYTSRILGGLATQLENLGEFEAATDFHNAAVQLASLRSIQDGQLLDPFAPAFTRLRRSQIHNKTGKNTLAQQDIRDAEAALAALPNSGQKMAFLNNIRLFQAIYYTKTNPQLAIEQLSEFINNPSDKYYLTQMYRSRAQAQRQLGNVSAAIADLQTAIDHFETQRQTVPPFQRIAFTGEARSAYEEMIDLQIEQGNIKEAFRYSEGAKARTLLESIQAGIKTPNPDLISANLALNALQKQLTAQQVVVEYSVVKDNLYAWVVTTTKIDMVRLTPTVSTLVSWNKQLQQRTPAQLPGLLADLYDQLWKPLSSYLPSDAETIIVPDQGVYEIPFAGLFDRQKGQFGCCVPPRVLQSI
jgi:tetratricopeptide (TPR) repeat protein